MRKTTFAAIGAILAVSVTLGYLAIANSPGQKADPAEWTRGLVARWPLAGDAMDRSSNNHHAKPHGAIDWTVAGRDGRRCSAAQLNGRDAALELPTGAVKPGTGDFSIAAWVYTDATSDDVPGDILSQYDAAQRRGFHLTIKNNAGVASTQANYRQLQFGIDNNHDSQWNDCGKPGNAILAFALVVHDGSLYAGTCEPGEHDTGHVYRYAGGTEWTDCGTPDASNAVTAMAAHGGKLYAGTGKYRLAGSALAESANPNLGGRVFRHDGGTTWTDCGRLPNVEAVGGLVEFRGKLYASSLYRPAGFFRYDGGASWTDCGTPGKRVEALGVYNGYIYATSYDGGLVFRFDGSQWTDCGQLGAAEANTQTYSFAVYEGRLFVGTWRSGRVYRFDDVGQWSDAGRLGEELEVMGMLVHNGRLMAGTLPLAEVYSYEAGATWRRMARLDHTPDVTYRRAWTMAEYQGRVYCSTLPSGRIYSFAAGASVTWDREFPPGWRHVAAVKSVGYLRLYVDGRQVAASDPFDPREYDLDGDAPARIGLGANDYFHGRLSDVRWYDRALSAADLAGIAAAP